MKYLLICLANGVALGIGAAEGERNGCKVLAILLIRLDAADGP